jgi:hypothetical protein
MPDQTRLLPPQVREARFLPATFNEETRTIEVMWSTGVRVRRYDWWNDEYYDEELEISEAAVDLTRLASGSAPVLDSHRTYGGIASQIGVVDKAWIENGEGRALLRLSQRDDIAGLVGDIRAGIIQNVSVGYTVQRYEITREAGQVPVYRAVAWTPTELSFVTVPAESGAGTRNDPSSMQGSPCVFHRGEIDRTHHQESNMPTANNVADATRAATPAADPAPAVTVADNAAANAQAATDAANRSAEIIELATRHGFADRAAGWIREGKDVGDVRALILNELATRDAASGGHINRVEAGTDEVDRSRAAAASALLARAMIVDPSTGKRYAIERDNPFRGLTLLDMARGSLERLGVRSAGMNKLELVGRAFTQSGSDFPVLLENAMHKSLQAAYAVAPDTWTRFCAQGSVSDFRAHNRYRVGSLGNLDSLTELGEFKNKAIPDGEKASITASTKGNIINLSRQAIINDDLDAFIGLAAMLGRAAKRTVEADVYTYLASNPTMPDSIALFHADHGNLDSAGAPSVTTIDAARVKLASQTSVGGDDYLDLRPAIWLGGLTYGGSVRGINAAEYDPDTSNKLQKPNIVRGLFRDVVDSPRIADTKWYLFADPNEAPVIEVAFLEGNSEPFLDMEEGFTVDGARWKARLDYGIAAVDYRGAVRNG